MAVVRAKGHGSALPLGWPLLLAVGLASRAPAEEDFTTRRVVLTLPGMEQVRVESGHYKTKEGAELPLDVYSPRAPAKGERRGVVVLVHGGPVPPEATPHRWGVFQSYGRLIAASGLVAVTFTHRLHEATDYPRAAADTSALVDHVRGRAAALGADPDRLAVWVFSGGGPLASFILRDRPAFVRGVVFYYSILHFAGGPPVYAKVPRELSPVESLKSASGAAPPVLLARAGLDEDWIRASTDAFVAAANDRGVSVDLLTLPEGHHGFDTADDTPRSREVIRATLSFLKSRLAPGAP